MARPRKTMATECESVLYLMCEGYSIYNIAQMLKVSIMTVYRRLSEERERQEYIESLYPIPVKAEEFKVEIVVERSGTTVTKIDKTATKAIIAVS